LGLSSFAYFKRVFFCSESTILGDKGLLLPSLKHSGPKLNKESEEDIVEENLKRLQTLSEVSSVDQKSAEKVISFTKRLQHPAIKRFFVPPDVF